MRSVFKNKEVQELFNRQGYVVLDYVSPATVRAVMGEIYKLNPSDNFAAKQETKIPIQTYHCTFFDKNMLYREACMDIISELYKDFIEVELDNYKMIHANVFIKPPHSGEVSPHQNLTVTDESEYTSISLWCPTVNTTIDNGTLEVVPGSQKNFMKYRATTIPWPLCNFFKDQGKRFLEPLNVRAGQVVVLDDSIIHTTSMNQTDISRDVLHSILVPQEAPVYFFSLTPDYKQVERRSVPDTFLQTYIPGSLPPDYLPLDSVQTYSEGDFDLEKFDEVLAQARIQNNFL